MAYFFIALVGLALFLAFFFSAKSPDIFRAMFPYLLSLWLFGTFGAVIWNYGLYLGAKTVLTYNGLAFTEETMNKIKYQQYPWTLFIIFNQMIIINLFILRKKMSGKILSEADKS